MNQKLLAEYASLIVRKGANVQKGQLVMVKAPVEVYEFVRLVVEEAYKAGAGEVIVNYNDTRNNRADYIYRSLEDLKQVPDYVISKAHYQVDNKACFISLVSPDSEAMAGVDPKKVQEASVATSGKLAFLRNYSMNNDGQWTVAAVSSEVWAKKVFPDNPDAVEMLWNAILKACHVKEEGTIESWERHSDAILNHAKLLNDYDFERLYFKNGLGTDLEIYLASENVFGGGDEYSSTGVRFSPNIPTEEVFGMPYKTKVNGKVVATKPLNYQGGLIEDFYLEFKDGKVVDYGAKKGYDLLKSLVEFDEGSSYLGEVALISHDSPISNMGILFYNTLFDENASCHLALGQAYSMNTKDGTKLSKEELEKRGANFSHTHVDFMFGSADMDVVGVTRDGKELQIFKNGNFII